MWVYHLRKVPACIWKYHSPSSHLTRKKLATAMLAFSALSACPSPPILPNNTSLPHHQNQCKSLPSHITVSSVIWKKKLPAPPSCQQTPAPGQKHLGRFTWEKLHLTWHSSCPEVSTTICIIFITIFPFFIFLAYYLILNFRRLFNCHILQL